MLGVVRTRFPNPGGLHGGQALQVPGIHEASRYLGYAVGVRKIPS